MSPVHKTASKTGCKTCGGKGTAALQEGTLRLPARTSTLRIPQSTQLQQPKSSCCPCSETSRQNVGAGPSGLGAGTAMGGMSRARSVSSRTATSSSGNKKQSCKTCEGTGATQPSRRSPTYSHAQHVSPRSPASYGHSALTESDSDASPSLLRGQYSLGSSAEYSGGQDLPGRARRSPTPLITPPALGSHFQVGTPSPLSLDFSLGLLSRSSLERLVEEDLRSKASMSPGSPVRAKGSRATVVSPPVILTPRGPVQATHQVSLERTVKRLPDMEVINRRMTGITADECGCANQIELNIQNMEPGGLNESRKGESAIPLHEVVSVTNTVTVGPGVRARTSKTVYETTELPEGSDAAGGIDPGQVLEMIEEESKMVDKTKNLQPPELKGSATEDYGLKKRLQKLKLNPESVRRLESRVINPPPSADEPQEEPQPELMAAIMHTEEHGLNMDSAPASVYNYLFPDVKEDLIIKISPVAPSPLQNVVVPVAVPSQLHVAGITPEMQNVAENTLASQRALPVDNIFTKSVLKTDTLPKVNNTAVKGKKMQKTEDRYPLLISEEPPWEVQDLQPLIHLAGASPSNTLTAADISEGQLSSIHHNEAENSLEYQLIPEAPRHVSRVQLRGSQKPPWFPGYYIALPDTIKLAKSPSEVLPAAWQAVQPDIFADDSFLIVG